MGKVKFIEVDSEIGAGTRGASMGIAALKIAALNYGSALFKEVGSIKIKTENDLLYEPAKHKLAKNIEGIIAVYDRLSKSISELLKDGTFPVVLSGDHSVSGGSIAGIKKAFPNKRLGVIWIDAHADIHSPYTTPTGNIHGMPIAAALGEDNIGHQINHPDKETVALWNKLKNTGSPEPKIDYRDLVFIAVRDMEPEERYLLQHNKVKTFLTADVRRKGAEKIARDTMVHLNKCDLIYVSFDVDSMDASISKGTGTPVRGGITEKEAGALCMAFIQNPKVCCFEVSEINPTLDRENFMADKTFEILQRVVSKLM